MSNPKRFGRAWKVEIMTAKPNQDDPTLMDEVLYTFGSETWEPESLRIQFDVVQAFEAYWICDLVIYNLNLPEMQDMILFGMKLRLSAGYQSDLIKDEVTGLSGKLGVIFEGMIFQPLWEREESHTDKLTLHCIVAGLKGMNNFVGQTFAGNLKQRALVAQMAKACRQPMNVDASGVSDDQDSLITRATTMFGRPSDYLQHFADTNNSTVWMEDQVAHINQLLVDETVPQIEYNADNGLVGTPQQTQDGVLCKVLLDSRVTLRTQIKLSNDVFIRQQSRTPGGKFPTMLDNKGQYIVGRVHHYGDSRGNDWYTEITGFVNAGSLLSLRILF